MKSKSKAELVGSVEARGDKWVGVFERHRPCYCSNTDTWKQTCQVLDHWETQPFDDKVEAMERVRRVAAELIDEGVGVAGKIPSS